MEDTIDRFLSKQPESEPIVRFAKPIPILKYLPELENAISDKFNRLKSLYVSRCYWCTDPYTTVTITDLDLCGIYIYDPETCLCDKHADYKTAERYEFDDKWYILESDVTPDKYQVFAELQPAPTIRKMIFVIDSTNKSIFIFDNFKSSLLTKYGGTWRFLHCEAVPKAVEIIPGGPEAKIESKEKSKEKPKEKKKMMTNIRKFFKVNGKPLKTKKYEGLLIDRFRKPIPLSKFLEKRPDSICKILEFFKLDEIDECYRCSDNFTTVIMSELYEYRVEPDPKSVCFCDKHIPPEHKSAKMQLHGSIKYMFAKSKNYIFGTITEKLGIVYLLIIDDSGAIGVLSSDVDEDGFGFNWIHFIRNAENVKTLEVVCNEINTG